MDRNIMARMRQAALMQAFLMAHETPRATITDGNRNHTTRAPEGSPEAVAALNAAQLKRMRKAAKRAGNV